MRYVEARIDEYFREEAYRIYVTKGLQLAPQGKYIKDSYIDILKPRKIDKRNGNDIIIDIINKAGLKFGE